MLPLLAPADAAAKKVSCHSAMGGDFEWEGCSPFCKEAKAANHCQVSRGLPALSARACEAASALPRVCAGRRRPPKAKVSLSQGAARARSSASASSAPTAAPATTSSPAPRECRCCRRPAPRRSLGKAPPLPPFPRLSPRPRTRRSAPPARRATISSRPAAPSASKTRPRTTARSAARCPPCARVREAASALPRVCAGRRRPPQGTWPKCP